MSTSFPGIQSGQNLGVSDEVSLPALTKASPDAKKLLNDVASGTLATTKLPKGHPLAGQADMPPTMRRLDPDKLLGLLNAPLSNQSPKDRAELSAGEIEAFLQRPGVKEGDVLAPQDLKLVKALHTIALKDGPLNVADTKQILAQQASDDYLAMATELDRNILDVANGDSHVTSEDISLAINQGGSKERQLALHYLLRAVEINGPLPVNEQQAS